MRANWVIKINSINRTEVEQLERCLIAYFKPKLNSVVKLSITDDEILKTINDIELIEESKIYPCFEAKVY